MAATSCQAPAPAPATAQPTPIVVEPPATVQDSEPVPDEPIRIPDNLDDEERWLVVEEVKSGAAGAWATGDFDVDRNKLIIKAREVERFSIDMSKIPINWKRKVVLGINGRNSELRKRDFQIYHFARDRHGRWVVVE